MKDQNHPLYISERDHLDRLLSKELPDDQDLVDLARLFLRYEGFPGAHDIQMDMKKVLKLWRISVEDLHSSTRKIWSKGFRPGNSSDEIVGSGFDTSENSVN